MIVELLFVYSRRGIDMVVAWDLIYALPLVHGEKKGTSEVGLDVWIKFVADGRLMPI